MRRSRQCGRAAPRAPNETLGGAPRSRAGDAAEKEADAVAKGPEEGTSQTGREEGTQAREGCADIGLTDELSARWTALTPRVRRAAVAAHPTLP